MIIRDQKSFIELNLVEVDAPPAGLGDGHFQVKLSAHGFTGEHYVWIEAFLFHTFVDELERLVGDRVGAVGLESMSPHELKLVVRVVQQTGAVAVEGELRRNVVIQSRQQRVENRLVFSLVLEAEALPELLRQFQQIQSKFPLP